MIRLNIRRFASGTIMLSLEHSSSSVTFQGKIEWSSTANTSSNTSNVTAKLYARKQGSSQATSGTKWSGYITIDGTKVNYSTGSLSIKNDWVLVSTSTKNNISHNNDGTKSITIAGSVKGPSGTSLASITSSGSDTATLDRIQRASTLNSVVFNITTTNGVTTGTVTANFSKYISTYYDTLQVTSPIGNFSADFALSFPGITSGTPVSLTSSQLETIFKTYCAIDVGCAVVCRLWTKTGPSGSSVGYSPTVNSSVSLPDYEININNFTVVDNIDTYDNFKPTTKTFIANLSEPKFTFSASSTTGDTYYYPIVYTLNTTYNPDPEHPDWYRGDIYNNITSPYVLNPIAISSGMPFSLIANQGGYRYEKGDSTTIDDITVIDYQYPYAYCTFTRPTPTSTTINISGNISWYDGTGLQNLGTKSTTITYIINGVEQTKTIADNEYGTITTDSAHISRCSFTTTITIGASDYKYPISYSAKITDLLGVESPESSGQIPAGESLWYGYEDNNRNLHMVVNGELIGKGNIKGKTIEYGDVKDNPLPNGDLSSGSYWCSIPNGHYWIGSTGTYTNSPVQYGFVDKTGFYTKDGTVADYNVIIYSAIDGPIYRLYNNNTSTNTWRRVDGGATMMSLGLSSNQTVSQTGAVKINLSSSTVIGTGLSVSSNGIKIGAGIHYVEVSAVAEFSAVGGTNALRRLYIAKNSSNVAQACIRPVGTYESVTIPPRLISVAENDVIYLYLNSDNASQTVYGQAAQTYLTVKVVR